MKHMRKLMTVVAVLVLSSGCGSGCKKKRNEEGTGGPALPTTSEPGTGSTASGAPAGPKTPEGMAQRYEDCWAAWNANDWDKFGQCYASGAVVESPGSGQPAIEGRDAILKQASTEQKAAAPDLHAEVGLVLVNGSTVVGLVALHGHAAGKPVGILFGTVVHFDETGTQFDHEWAYMDALTLVHQATSDGKTPVRAPLERPPVAHAVVIAKDDSAERDNVRSLDALLAAYNKHDGKAWADLFSDDGVFSDATEATDRDKKTTAERAKPLWQAMPDARLTATSTWAAGDYVAAIGTFDGTDDHDSALHKKTDKKASLPFLLVTKIDHGKVSRGWLVYQAMSLFQQLGWTDLLPAAAAASGSGNGSGSGSGTGSGNGSGNGSGSATPAARP
jgi:ketosteroid isomerase-like protein